VWRNRENTKSPLKIAENEMDALGNTHYTESGKKSKNEQVASESMVIVFF
jgi:hypothetical protein